MSNADIENLIERSFRRLLLAPNAEEKRQAFLDMAFWIKARTPEIIRAMEIEKGLCL